MLSKPDSGWTHFQLGKESYRLSYLTDVAFEWLTQAIHGLETLDVFSVHAFSDPGRMICTVSFWSCYIIFEDDGPAPACNDITHIHVNMIDFCKKLYHEIDSNFDSWVHWDDDELESSIDSSPDEGDACEEDEMEKAIRERQRKLRDKLCELKKLIEENEEYFDGGSFF